MRPVISPSVRVLLSLLVAVAVWMVCMPLLSCAKFATEKARVADAPGAMGAPAEVPGKAGMGGPPPSDDMAGEELAAEAEVEGQMAVAGAPTHRGPVGYTRSAGGATPLAPKSRPINKDAYYSSTYVGGSGERDRIEKLVNDGVVIDGKTVKLAAFTREYSKGLTIPTDKALNVQVDLEQSKIDKAGGEVHVQVGLHAIKREAPKRPAINLCLVIDRSGSMEDEGKINFAKKAATDVINGLAATDYLGIVAYDDDAQVLLPSQKLTRKAAASRQVQSLLPGGATNIHEGLQMAYGEVKRHFTKDGINQVILLSDGMVTAGVEDPYAFRELVSKMADADIQTTSVGMGIDFDEELMMGIAQQGRGGYHFIRDAAQTQEIFQKELGQLTRVVAKAVKLRIELPESVELLRVLGSSALSQQEAAQTKRTEQRIDDKVYDDLGIKRDRQKEDEPGIKMLIPHFYAGDSHVVMLRVRVPRGKQTRQIAKVEVKYKDLVFRKNRTASDTATVRYTTDKGAVVASVSRPVKKNVLGFKTGEALLTAAEHIKQGRVPDAAKAIDEHMVVLGVAAREWRDEDLDRDGELLDRYKYVIVSAGGSVTGTDLGNYLAKSLTYSGYELTR